MTSYAQNHLKRYPGARSSTLARLIKRDQMTEQLQRELGIPKRKSFWQRLLWWRA